MPTDRAPGKPVVSAMRKSWQLAHHKEVEIKFRADETAFQAVLTSGLFQKAGVPTERELISAYFDTASNDLHRAGSTLRVRRVGKGVPLVGLKWEERSATEAFARGEVEVRSRAGLPSLDLFESSLRRRLQNIVGGRPLEKSFETRVSRRVLTIHQGSSEIEAALDEGVIISGDSRLPLREVELELKRGTLLDLLDCAAAIAQTPGLSLEFESKADRGYRLRNSATPKPTPAPGLACGVDSRFNDLFVAVIENTLNHFTANWAPLLETDDPESVHQLRVALRRMRSAFRIYRRVMGLTELEVIRSEAGRIAAALGPPRDCDVFLESIVKGPFQEKSEALHGATTLLAAVAAQRSESYSEARHLIRDPATSLFVLKVQSFLVRSGWSAAVAQYNPDLLTSNASDYAAGVLERLRRRAIKKGSGLPNLTNEERHELRIVLKNLRYAIEFFSRLFDRDKRVRDFHGCVARLQDQLGVQNDLANAQSFVAELKLPPASDSNYAAGYVLGWNQRATVDADRTLMKNWKHFLHAKAFWN